MLLKKLLSIISILLVGCATTANYEKMLEKWVGASLDSLVIRWGPPTNSYPLSNGWRLIEYTNQRNIQIGGYTQTVPITTVNTGSASAYGTGGSAYGTYSGTSTTYVQRTSPTQNISMSCVTRFTVDSDGKIGSWTWQGNDCRALDQK